MKTLKVHSSGRRLITEDGERIYLIGDTAWELFHALTREEAEMYLRTRKAQGYNMIQCVVLAEHDGLRVPNPYGRLPLRQNEQGEYDPRLPDTGNGYDYYDHMEYILTLAEEMGLYIGLLPTWGDKINQMWGVGPVIFNADNAFAFGEFIGRRCVHHQNIFWVMGGDRPYTEPEHLAALDAMAAGIKAGDGGKFLMTFHPWGEHSSSEYVQDRDWLDFHMLQSGHNRPAPASFDLIARDYSLQPVRPVMDGEQCYEDSPINIKPGEGYYDDYDVRLTAWRNLLSGACGNTYGHFSVWQMLPAEGVDDAAPNSWQTALHRPAAEQMRYYRDFIDRHDLTGFVPVCDAVEPNAHDCTYVAALVSPDTALLLSPAGAPMKLNTAALPFAPTRCRTFEPRTGTYGSAAHLSPEGVITFPGRQGGRQMDILVILEK